MTWGVWREEIKPPRLRGGGSAHSSGWVHASDGLMLFSDESTAASTADYLNNTRGRTGRYWCRYSAKRRPTE